MIKGFYAAVSAMLVNANRQQLLSHNIANLQTPGFKEIMSTVQDFVKTPVTFPAGNITHSYTQYVGTLGLGAMSGPEVTDFAQGGLQLTGNPFDLAIQGDGFFRVRTPAGEQYTRDGRFLRNTNGQLVTLEGYQVLGKNGQPIQLNEGDTVIAGDGTITVNGTQAGHLGLAVFQNPRSDLTRTEGNYFSANQAPAAGGTVQVSQGSLEMSNANPTAMMTQLVEVGRSYEAAQQMVQNQDELLGKTISTLGRIG